MSTNYRWHKRQANDRVQARLREAEVHRQAKQANGRSPSPFILKLVPFMIGVIVAIWLLTGCSVNYAPFEQEASATAQTRMLTMADRIRFQDRRDAILETYRLVPQVAEMSMADRIHFQDERDGGLWDETSVGQRVLWTMAERIRFHDRLWERSSPPVR